MRSGDNGGLVVAGLTFAVAGLLGIIIFGPEPSLALSTRIATVTLLIGLGLGVLGIIGFLRRL